MKQFRNLSLVLFLTLCLHAKVAVAYAPNEVITEFGTSGVALSSEYADTVTVTDMVRDEGNTGDLIIVGTVGTSTTQDILLVRFDKNGNKIFEVRQNLIPNSGPNTLAETPKRIKLDSGNIYVAGIIYDSTGSFSTSQDLFVARFTSAGVLDTTNFGSSSTPGFAVDILSGNTERLVDFAVVGTTIYLAGDMISTTAGTDFDLIITEYNTSTNTFSLNKYDVSQSINPTDSRQDDIASRLFSDGTNVFFVARTQGHLSISKLDMNLAYVAGTKDITAIGTNTSEVYLKDASLNYSITGHPSDHIFVLLTDAIESTYYVYSINLSTLQPDSIDTLFTTSSNLPISFPAISGPLNLDTTSPRILADSSANDLFLVGSYSSDMVFGKLLDSTNSFDTSYTGSVDVGSLLGTGTSTDEGSALIHDGEKGLFLAGVTGTVGAQKIALIHVFGAKTCGDKNTDTNINEGCDDGNLTNHDGCSDECQTESLYCVDADGDNHPDRNTIYLTGADASNNYPSYLLCTSFANPASDCDDTNADIHPASTKTCALKNEIIVDYNCDGSVEGYCNSDSDSKLDNIDNCPLNANEDQADMDLDGEGDACDGDIDGDGYVNVDQDTCPLVANASTQNDDYDHDGTADACDTQTCGKNGQEGTEQCDNNENNGPTTNCSTTCLNQTLFYADGDGDDYANEAAFSQYAVTAPAGFVAQLGDCNDTNPSIHPDATDTPNNDVDEDCKNGDEVLDSDGDGLADNLDKCPFIVNAGGNGDQTDTDGDGTGDACDSTPNGDTPTEDTTGDSPSSADDKTEDTTDDTDETDDTKTPSTNKSTSSGSSSGCSLRR